MARKNLLPRAGKGVARRGAARYHPAIRVLIVGCGYVGLPLGAKLVRLGHEVFGVRRTWWIFTVMEPCATRTGIPFSFIPGEQKDQTATPQYLSYFCDTSCLRGR